MKYLCTFKRKLQAIWSILKSEDFSLATVTKSHGEHFLHRYYVIHKRHEFAYIIEEIREATESISEKY